MTNRFSYLTWKDLKLASYRQAFQRADAEAVKASRALNAISGGVAYFDLPDYLRARFAVALNDERDAFRKRQRAARDLQAAEVEYNLDRYFKEVAQR